MRDHCSYRGPGRSAKHIRIENAWDPAYACPERLELISFKGGKGRGVVAKEFIHKGELVLTWAGIQVSNTEEVILANDTDVGYYGLVFDHKNKKVHSCVPLDADGNPSPTTFQHPMIPGLTCRTPYCYFLNEDTSPNLGMRVLSKCPLLFAKRDIQAGEELTWFYGKSYDRESKNYSIDTADDGGCSNAREFDRVYVKKSLPIYRPNATIYMLDARQSVEPRIANEQPRVIDQVWRHPQLDCETRKLTQNFNHLLLAQTTMLERSTRQIMAHGVAMGFVRNYILKNENAFVVTSPGTSQQDNEEYFWAILTQRQYLDLVRDVLRNHKVDLVTSGNSRNVFTADATTWDEDSDDDIHVYMRRFFAHVNEVSSLYERAKKQYAMSNRLMDYVTQQQRENKRLMDVLLGAIPAPNPKRPRMRVHDSAPVVLLPQNVLGHFETVAPKHSQTQISEILGEMQETEAVLKRYMKVLSSMHERLQSASSLSEAEANILNSHTIYGAMHSLHSNMVSLEDALPDPTAAPP